MGFGRLFVQQGEQPVIKDRWWDAAGRRSLQANADGEPEKVLQW
jgi:hypothetical protein